MRGGMGSSEWNHGEMVCSMACGKRLHQRIENGELDGNDYQGLREVMFGGAREDTTRIRQLRTRIKQLVHRLKATGR